MSSLPKMSPLYWYLICSKYAAADVRDESSETFGDHVSISAARLCKSKSNDRWKCFFNKWRLQD